MAECYTALTPCLVPALWLDRTCPQTEVWDYHMVECVYAHHHCMLRCMVRSQSMLHTHHELEDM